MMKSYKLIETSQFVLLNEEKYPSLGNIVLTHDYIVLTHDYARRTTQSSNTVVHGHRYDGYEQTELVSLYKLQVTAWDMYYA